MLHDSLFPGACVSGGCHLLSPAKADAHAHRHVHAHTHHPDTRTTVIVMERSHASAYPTLSFVNINNPDETKLRSKKRAVRSHVAYYQHHKDDDKGGSRTTGSRRRRGKRAAQVQQAQPEDQTVSRRREPGSAHASSSSPVSTVASRGSSVSIKSEPGALSAPASRRGSLQLDHISLGTRVDPFHMYPVPWKDEYNPIIDFYLEYVCRDVPQITQKGKMFLLRTSWFPFALTSPTVFYAAMSLGAAVYAFKRKEALYKPPFLELCQNAIASINESLSNPDQGADDFTIGAVFCMCCMESFCGDSPSFHVHMSGLAKMVRMRGGLQNLALDGLMKRMIVWLDFNHSTKHGSNMYFDQSLEVSKRSSPFRYDDLRGPDSP